MIARTSNECQTENQRISVLEPGAASVAKHSAWQAELAGAQISPQELLAALHIPLAGQRANLLAHEQSTNFPLRVTRSFIARMKPGDINDPLLRQVLPLQDEALQHPQYSADPLDEQRFNPAPGVIQKYRSRALLIVTQACAIHCRYCFRKQFPYSDNRPGLAGWQKSLEHLRRDSSINEVIYSGGDPLAASDEFLAQLTDRIAQIKHINRLRLHSRLPVVLPKRVDDSLLAWLERWPGQRVLVIHCNHPNELDSEVGAALARLAAVGVTLLNQAVLLRGVNDEASTQIALSEKLFAYGVMPYYLHMLDKVSGTQHFSV
ncbi:MAG: EF-P beta-lysylation protein EpmB, partial [Pseudomonadales bacterium]|nr:EF-P beta-lysylation protein EpmB [Pseudomonadales bacterium]